MRITWLKPEERIEHEFHQLHEEGIDISSLQIQWQELVCSVTDSAGLRIEAERLLDECQRLEEVSEAGCIEVAEPSDLAAIKARASAQDCQSCPTFSEQMLFEHILGGWTGRMAGCLLGKPVEKVPREGIRAILQNSNQWPLNNYFTGRGVPDEVTQHYPWNRASRNNSLRENIVCMPEDDDINFTMLNLHVLETAGEGFGTEDIARAWLEMLPVMAVFTAERVAYVNLLALREPPETATYRNPYREWIGAQIRADLWGWASPGDPERAAELAWRDARLSHVKNGIYGEMYIAAMVAEAFVTDDVRKVVNAGLTTIPASSRLAEAIRFACTLADKVGEWEEIVDRVYERYGHYHWVHTINNATLLTAALLCGAGDFERSICYAVTGGWDTDCNGATVGSILGTILGYERIPDKWSAPLNNRVRSSLRGFDNSSIEDLAVRTVATVPMRYRR